MLGVGIRHVRHDKCLAKSPTHLLMDRSFMLGNYIVNALPIQTMMKCHEDNCAKAQHPDGLRTKPSPRLRICD